MLALYEDLDFQQSVEVDLETLHADLTTCMQIWDNLCVQDRLPSWSKVNLLDFPTKIIPLITVIDINWNGSEIIDGDAMHYRFWGTGHVNAKNVERTGLKLTEKSNRVDVVVAEYLKVINNKKPFAFRKYIRIDKTSGAAIQTTIRLPLSDDGQRVDGVLSASIWDSIVSEH